jgi:hypothetical protein
MEGPAIRGERYRNIYFVHFLWCAVFRIFIKIIDRLCPPRAMGSDETLPSSSNHPIYEVCKVWWVHLSATSGTEAFI